MSKEVKAKPRKFSKTEMASIDTAAKLNMSLDDIVSLEKTQKKFSKSNRPKPKAKAKAKAVAGKASPKAKGMSTSRKVRVTAASVAKTARSQVHTKTIGKTRVKRASIIRTPGGSKPLGARQRQQMPQNWNRPHQISNNNGNWNNSGRQWNNNATGWNRSRQQKVNTGGFEQRKAGFRGSGKNTGGPMESRVVIVRNIPFDVSWQDVKDAFQSNGGPIERCNVENGTARIIFQSSVDAKSAVKTFDGGDMNGRRISVRLG